MRSEGGEVKEERTAAPSDVDEGCNDVITKSSWRQSITDRSVHPPIQPAAKRVTLCYTVIPAVALDAAEAAYGRV